MKDRMRRILFRLVKLVGVMRENACRPSLVEMRVEILTFNFGKNGIVNMGWFIKFTRKFACSYWLVNYYLYSDFYHGRYE